MKAIELMKNIEMRDLNNGQYLVMDIADDVIKDSEEFLKSNTGCEKVLSGKLVQGNDYMMFFENSEPWQEKHPADVIVWFDGGNGDGYKGYIYKVD